jgi:hypothetical protein
VDQPRRHAAQHGTYSVKGILEHDLLTLIKVRIALLAPHQLDHALCSNRSTLVSQQESTTGLEQIRDVIDIEFKVVQKDLEDVQNRIWLSHLEFGKFTIKANILNSQQDHNDSESDIHTFNRTESSSLISFLRCKYRSSSSRRSMTPAPTSGMYMFKVAMRRA